MGEQSQTEKKYSFLSINRGRYLCPVHGSFCDSSDNYLEECPLCKKNGKSDAWQANKIDRLLQVVGGLQNRSKRSVALLASLIGGIGLLRLVDALGGAASIPLFSPAAKLLVSLAVVALFASLAMYSASMRHVRTADKDAPKEMRLEEWERYFASHLHRMEGWHVWAGRWFVTGAGVLAIAIMLQMICSVDIGQISAWFRECLGTGCRYRI